MVSYPYVLLSTTWVSHFTSLPVMPPKQIGCLMNTFKDPHATFSLFTFTRDRYDNSLLLTRDSKWRAAGTNPTALCFFRYSWVASARRFPYIFW